MQIFTCTGFFFDLALLRCNQIKVNTVHTQKTEKNKLKLRAKTYNLRKITKLNRLLII
jgi:hypothetical protein